MIGKDDKYDPPLSPKNRIQKFRTLCARTLSPNTLQIYVAIVFFVFFKVKQDFFELLSDYHVDGQQRWSKVKEKMETDPRYKAVETSASREELFKNYVERLAKVSEAASLYIVPTQQMRNTILEMHENIGL